MLKKTICAFVAAACAVGVTATASAESPARLEAKSVQKQQQPRLDVAKLPAQIGNEKWVVLLCRFADSPTARPLPMAAYDAAFNTHPRSHRKYFQEASYGQLNLSFKVNNWRTIAKRSTFGSYSADGNAFMFRLYDACTKAHDPITNFAGFDGIAMFFDDREIDKNHPTEACQFGDSCTTKRTIETNMGWFNLVRKPLDGANGFRVIWMAHTGDVPNEVTAHEMHHAYGAPHSAAGTDDVNDSECQIQGRDVCSHFWDLMGSAWLSLPTDTHTLAATKVFYHKWIAGTRRCNVVNDVTNAEFQLERLARPLNNGCLAITIKYSEGCDVFGCMTFWYVVEARFPIGFDSAVPGPAVLISRICIGQHQNCSINNNGEPVVLGLKQPDPSGQIDEASAEWQPPPDHAPTFVNFDGKIRVEVRSKGAGFYTVRVSRASGGGLTP